jgi:hypothetical protein
MGVVRAPGPPTGVYHLVYATYVGPYYNLVLIPSHIDQPAAALALVRGLVVGGDAVGVGSGSGSVSWMSRTVMASARPETDGNSVGSMAGSSLVGRVSAISLGLDSLE